MTLNADVFSWGRNLEGQLGDDTTVSTFTSAATAYPVENGGASDNFDIFNIEREEVVRGITTNIPSSASRWVLTGESGGGNANYVVEDGKLKWDGTGNTSVQVTGTLSSNYRLQQYRWQGATNFKIEVDWEILNWDQPSSGTNYMRLLIWVSSAAYVIVGRRIDSVGTDETFLTGVPSTGTVTWVGAGTDQTSGKFKIEYIGSALTIFGWNETANQWEWDGNTAGYVVTEDVVAPVFIFQHIQQTGSGMNVEWSNLNVIGDVPYGNNAVNPEVPTPGFAYWEQPQSAQGGIGNPFLEFSGDTPGTTANNITRTYRTYDGSLDTFGPLIEGASLPLWTVAGGNLYWDGITNNPNGARDLHPLLIFEEDFEIIWETNIISAPNTCCWSTRLSCYQFGPVRGTSLMSYEPEYGYSGSRRYRIWKDPGTGGSWQNSTARTDAVIRIKIIHSGNDWESWGWWNGIWNQLGSSMTQTSTHGPTVLTMRFSNWSVWPGFQADFESLTIVPSGTPDGSFYYADAPYVPSPSGFTDETVITVGDPQFEDMVGGVNHAVGLKEDGSAFAWGDNQFGQLGDGTLVNKSSPVSVQGNKSFSELAPAADHNLALDAEGNLFSWGRNDFGQLGFTTPCDATEEELQGLGYPCEELTEEKLPWIFDGQLSGTGQVLETATGTIWTWGSGVNGSHGQGLGFGFPNTSNPGSVLGGYSWTAMGLGSNHMIAITADGDVYGWGNNNDGQLGTGASYPGGADSPVSALPLPRGIKAIHPGSDWMCENCNKHGMICGGDEWSLFIGEDRRVYGMGRNSNVRGGALGDGTYNDKSSPVACYEYLRIGEVICGESTSYGINWSWEGVGGSPGGIDEIPQRGATGDSPIWGNSPRGALMPHGQVWATGQNESGQLGNSTTTSVNSPVRVGTPGNWFYANRVSAGARFACGAAIGGAGGRVLCWGSNWYGKLGDGVTATGSNDHQSIPVTVFGQKAMKDFSCGQNHVCALDANDGSMWCWGLGRYGQLGTGAFNISVSSPVSVFGNRSYISVGCSSNSTCGMLENGDMYCWGGGRLSGDSTSLNSPTLIPAISPARVPASPRFIVDTTDYLDCDGTKVVSPVSVDATYITASTGLDHSLAIDRDYQVWAWGRNTDGQLGIVTTPDTLPTGPGWIDVTSNEYWTAIQGAIWNTGGWWDCDGVVGAEFEPKCGWEDGFRPTALRFTYTGGTLDQVRIEDKRPNTIAFNGSYVSGVTIPITWGTGINERDIWSFQWWNSGSPAGIITQIELLVANTGNFDSSRPVLVDGLPDENFIKVTGGKEHSCAMTELGDVWCWGNNEFGQASISPLDIGAISAGGQGYGGAIDYTTGNLWMWGQGVNGVLGTNSIANRSSPVTVAGPQGWGLYEGEIGPMIQAAKQIPGGARGMGMFSDNVSWATKTDGSLWMWGDATQGNLGTGQFETNYSSPRSVLGGINFFFVASTPGSPASTYALDINGDIWVFGATSYILGGGLGGAASSYNSPVKVEDFIFADDPLNPFIGKKFHVLSAGTFGGMALTGTTAWGWGSNASGYQGRLCTGDLVNYNSPIEIPGTWIHLAHGNNNSMLVDTFGNVWGCGARGGGLSGWGAGGTYESDPTAILGGPHSAIKVAAGNAAQVFGFLRADGSLWMWGSGAFGQLGVGDTSNRTSPTSVLGSGDLYNFVDFVVGGQSGTVAIDDTGQVWGWGHWSSVGDNTTTQRTSPTKTSLAVITPETFKTPSLVTSGATDLDAGGYHNIILDTSDKAWSWGRNDLGQLGDNSLTDKYDPVSVYTTHKFVDISAGEQHSWAMKADGTICTWGAGDWGKLLWNTDENPRSTPTCGVIEGIACVPFLPNTGNFAHSTFMQCGSQFIAWTWGCNTDGKLGDGSITNRSTPVQVIGNKRWLDMSGGGDFTIAIDDEGRIWSWGDDSLGQLGDG